MARRPMRGINMEALKSIQAQQDLYKQSGLTGELGNESYEHVQQVQPNTYQPEPQPPVISQPQGAYNESIYSKIGITPEMLQQRQEYDDSATAALYYSETEHHVDNQQYMQQQAEAGYTQNQQGYAMNPGLNTQNQQGGYNVMQGQQNQNPQGQQYPQPNQNQNQQGQQFDLNQQYQQQQGQQNQQFNPNQQYDPNQQYQQQQGQYVQQGQQHPGQQFDPNQQYQQFQQQPNQNLSPSGKKTFMGLTLSWQNYAMGAAIIIAIAMLVWRYFIM